VLISCNTWCSVVCNVTLGAVPCRVCIITWHYHMLISPPKRLLSIICCELVLSMPWCEELAFAACASCFNFAHLLPAVSLDMCREMQAQAHAWSKVWGWNERIAISNQHRRLQAMGKHLRMQSASICASTNKQYLCSWEHESLFVSGVLSLLTRAFARARAHTHTHRASCRECLCSRSWLQPRWSTNAAMPDRHALNYFDGDVEG
jgi:hypothetical protein